MCASHGLGSGCPGVHSEHNAPDADPTCENCGEDTEAAGLCAACQTLECEYCGDVVGPANNIPTGAGYANACDYCAKKLRAAQDREDARESAGDDAYDRMKDERGTVRP